MQEPRSIPLSIAGVAVRAESASSAPSGALGSVATSGDAGRLAGPTRYRGAYVHVPFCRHKCHYCDFYSFVDSENRSEAFVSRLEEELAASSGFFEAPLETVFVGGGTPTMLPAALLRRALIAIRERLPIRTDAEWSVEANPETVDDAIADALAASGVRRVSLGAQSFNPQLLKALERDHDPASVERAVGRLRRAGIPEINLDLIFAIPGSTMSDWQHDLDRALALSPDHLSAYGLVYEPNTPLAVKLRKGFVTRLPEDDEADQYEFVVSMLAARGYERYEISNWSLPGKTCRHNILYWENADWWGFGPSAASHGSGVRWRNIPRLATWLEQGPFAPVENVEILDADGRAGECFMLGLRMMSGLPVDRVAELLALGVRGESRSLAIERFKRDGLLEVLQGRLRLTSRGLMIADTILSTLI